MVLDATAAKALAAIILISTQGEERLTPQLPLEVVDRGDDLFVRGTPCTDAVQQTQYNAFWVFIRKSSVSAGTLERFPPPNC